MNTRGDPVFLAADVGGTRARFLLARWRGPEADSPWEPLSRRVFADDDFPHFDAALDAFLAECPPGAEPKLAVIALAGPVTGRRARLTNRPWTIDADALAARHGWPRVELMNDFAAQAFGLAAAPPGTLHVLQKGERRPGLAAVLGPGTGLGMGFFLREGETSGNAEEMSERDEAQGARSAATETYQLDRRGSEHRATRRFARAANYSAFPLRVFPSEGGHADLGGFDPPFLAAWSAWLAREGRIASWESLLCGPGLVRLAAFLAAERGQSAPWPDAPALVAAAGKGDPLAETTVHTFVRALGACAGDLALIGWTVDGVYLVGALAAALRPWLDAPAFRAAFAAKERHAGVLATLPILLAEDPLLGLKGAAAFACHLLAGAWA